MSQINDDGSFYGGKTILAPMVRAGRTPLRCQALEYGADLVYTEEIIDQKFLASQRSLNDVLQTVDYSFEKEVVLRVANERERSRCVLQVGTSSAERIAEVARKVGTDVAAIDINMGCPKPFSIMGGMGAALLTNPEAIQQILTSLVAVSRVPVSCKIRVLDKLEDTLCLARMIERCGVAALGVHGRRRDERQGHTNRNDEIREVARTLSIPVIANGGSGTVKEFGDIERFRSDCGASSVMLARRGLSNPSVFREKGPLSMDDEITDFLKLACEFDESFTTTKYVVQRILGSQQEFDERGRATVLAANVADICDAWALRSVYHKFSESRRAYKNSSIFVDPDIGATIIDVSFPPKRLSDRGGASTPKCVLNKLCDRSCIKRPTYACQFRSLDKRYVAVVEVSGRKFLSRMGQPNKKMAEQVAALAALMGMDKRDQLSGRWEED